MPNQIRDCYIERYDRLYKGQMCLDQSFYYDTYHARPIPAKYLWVSGYCPMTREEAIEKAKRLRYEFSFRDTGYLESHINEADYIEIDFRVVSANGKRLVRSAEIGSICIVNFNEERR